MNTIIMLINIYNKYTWEICITIISFLILIHHNKIYNILVKKIFYTMKL